MKKIVVTGGAGKLGGWVIEDLLAHGYDVLSVDVQLPKTKLCRHIPANLNNLGEVYGILKDSDAVIHLAAIPAPVLRTPEYIFSNNTLSTYNILEAASVLGMPKAVIGSSESIYGICWSVKPVFPLYVPIDEEHPLQISECYGLSKQTNEMTASMFHQRTGMQIASLRFACIIAPADYENFRNVIEQPEMFKLNCWSYVDVRDAATACRLALETDGIGAAALNITADETLAEAHTMELIRRYYPNLTDIREPLDGHALIYTNRKAKQMLNWKPEFSWRNSTLAAL